MAKILSLWLIVMFAAVTVQATTYSCRDKQGKLYVTDNLQALPAECRGRTQKVEAKDPDNLNYVPAQADPRGAEEQFQQEVRDVEREQKQKKERTEKLLQRAEQLAEQYKQAVQEKNSATRRWSYNSREVIQKADERIKQAREGKKQLLAEIKKENISRQDEVMIVSRLDEIED
jgi:DNA anti-recombination protein RmuC